MRDRVLRAARAEGERMWPMPLDDDYKEYLKSAFADLANVGGRWGGAITAAMFLKEFAEDTPWVHLDIAGTAWLDEAKPYMAKGPTGLAGADAGAAGDGLVGHALACRRPLAGAAFRSLFQPSDRGSSSPRSARPRPILSRCR